MPVKSLREPLRQESAMPNILIVDDEPHIRMLLEEALESLEDDGAELHFAENGEEALSQVEAIKPDLIFLDIMMPKMNGFDVCHTIKNKWKMQDIKIVMLTAKGQEFDKKRGMEVGADIYMTKPFNPIDLIKQARELLNM